MPTLPKRRSRPVGQNFAMLRGLSGQLSSTVNMLTNSVMTELTRKRGSPQNGGYRYSIKEYREMLETEPLSKACYELIRLRLRTLVGDYQHDDKEVQEWIRSNFETMSGSLDNVKSDCGAAVGYGFYCGEIVVSSHVQGYPNQWRLERINPLDPEKIRSFVGTKGHITHVAYNDNGETRYIPYNKVIHIVYGGDFGNPFGSPACERGMPYAKAKQLLYSEMLVAGKNNATGLLLLQADSNDTVQILDANGQPALDYNGQPRRMSAVEAIALQAQNLEQNGILATDLKNRVTPLIIPNNDNFWQISIQSLKKEILLSFMTPSLIWDEGSFSGLGNMGVSGNHKAILDANIAAIAVQIQEELLEKVVRPLLSYHFLPHVWKKNFGQFKSNTQNDPNFLASQAGNLIAAISSQLLPTSDVDVMNALREALGVPPVDERRMLELLQKQIEMQTMQQGAIAPPEGAQQDPQAAGAGFSYW